MLGLFCTVLLGASRLVAAAIALVVMLGVGLPALLSAVHTRGALAVPPWNPFTSYPGWASGELESSMRGPEAPNNWHRLALVFRDDRARPVVALYQQDLVLQGHAGTRPSLDGVQEGPLTCRPIGITTGGVSAT